jgi:hypothetical protein
MFALTNQMRYHLFSEPTDMRKSFTGLSGLINNYTELSPTNGDVFIFINRSRNKIKLLHWEDGGFVLYYKRLEQGVIEDLKFNNNSIHNSISYKNLLFLIEGICLKNIKEKKRYKLNINTQ